MLEPLLNPDSIAIIGASGTPGKFGHIILANLINGGFQGRIVPINPHTDQIMGHRCWPSLQHYAEKIDLSLIVVPQPLVLQAVHDSIAAGARAIVINSGGFKEVDEAGADLERKIAEICTSRNILLLGPNSLGLINTGHKLNALHAAVIPKQGGISMISQSSSICATYLEQVTHRELGIAKVISTGNKAQLSEIDLLKALGRDGQTKIIAGYLENISAGDEFVKNAENASLQKPVIILKSATTEAGRRAAAAHNGELISADTAYGAAFKRAGVIRADSFGDLLDLTTAFSLQPLPRGNRILVITNAGGPGIMAVDAIVGAGLQPAYFEPGTATALHRHLPKAATIYNPVDLLGNAGPNRYGAAIKAAMDSPDVDAVVVIMVDRITCRPFEIADTIIKNCNGEKPLMVSFLGIRQDEIRALLKNGGIPEYDSPEQAVNVLKAMCGYVAWRQRPPRVVTRFRVNRRRVERILFRKLRADKTFIIDAKAKAILQAYDFQIPAGGMALNAEEALEIAARIGYPVAMKIISPGIIHKKDLGGLRLNLNNRQAIIDAYDLMMLRVKQRASAAVIDGVYIEKMLDRGLEVILGMNRDPKFGPMLMFGLGGIFVEMLKDVAFHLAPITFTEAVQMLTSTKSYKSMLEARGKDGVDLTAIAQCLQKISQLATDFPQITELEINPLIIGEPGTDPVVVNARLAIKPGQALHQHP